MTEVELRWRASSLTLAIATCAAAALGGAVLTGRADLVVFAAPLLGVLCSIGWQRRPPTVTVQAQPPLHRCFEDEAVRVTVTAGLDDDIRRRYGIPKDVDGVVVTTVSARGRSFGKLQRGDVLVEVNFERVTTVTDTISKVEAAMTTPRQPLLLRVKRRGEAGWFDQFISVDLTNS